MQDAPDRGGGEEPGAGGQVAVGIGELVHVAGAEALLVEPGCQLAQGGGA